MKISFEFETKPFVIIDVLCIDTGTWSGSLFYYRKDTNVISWDFLYLSHLIFVLYDKVVEMMIDVKFKKLLKQLNKRIRKK